MSIGLATLLTKQIDGNRRLVVYTDCQSLVQALEKDSLSQKNIRVAKIWKMIHQLINGGNFARIVFQWVPSHCRSECKELDEGYSATSSQASAIIL